jgi:hypothetical protein
MAKKPSLLKVVNWSSYLISWLFMVCYGWLTVFCEACSIDVCGFDTTVANSLYVNQSSRSNAENEACQQGNCDEKSSLSWLERSRSILYLIGRGRTLHDREEISDAFL